jgi:hypothetical protein
LDAGRRDVIAIETKASRTVGPADLRGLSRFADYRWRPQRPMDWYLGRDRKRLDEVDVLPWQAELEELGC